MLPEYDTCIKPLTAFDAFDVLFLRNTFRILALVTTKVIRTRERFAANFALKRSAPRVCVSMSLQAPFRHEFLAARSTSVTAFIRVTIPYVTL